MNLSERFWADTCHYAVTLINRMPTAIIGNNTPYELFYNKKPRVDTLKVFGCICYVYVPSQVRKKLDQKAIKCIFLGIDVIKTGYRCFDIDDEKFYISKSVKFDEMQKENIRM